jgi:hypothetical protein
MPQARATMFFDAQHHHRPYRCSCLRYGALSPCHAARCAAPQRAPVFAILCADCRRYFRCFLSFDAFGASMPAIDIFTFSAFGFQLRFADATPLMITFAELSPLDIFFDRYFRDDGFH